MTLNAIYPTNPKSKSTEGIMTNRNNKIDLFK